MTNDYSRAIYPSVLIELDEASVSLRSGRFIEALLHLERAHVMAQPSTGLHILVHWRMLQLYWRQSRICDVWKQLFRLVSAGLFTMIGLVPTGNTGGSNVSAFRRMPIPDDLQRLIDAANRSEGSG